jgi:2,3-dihydroxy-p-cumate/2,3-dihydroxybenzoate 3,4-dioxygenase
LAARRLRARRFRHAGCANPGHDNAGIRINIFGNPRAAGRSGFADGMGKAANDKANNATSITGKTLEEKMTDNPFNYRKLGYVALKVTDLERSISFYRDVVGLDLTEKRTDGTAFLRCSDSPHDLVLCQANEPGVKRISFELESDNDLDKAVRLLGDLGVAVEQVDKAESDGLRQGRTVRFALPTNGVPFELYSGVKNMPTGYEPRLAKILRLGHVVIGVTAFDASVEWLMNKFGFRASDYIINRFAFLRCYPNPYHHSLGLETDKVNKLHHIAFMVKDINDIGSATNRLRKAGTNVVFGPGRHVASGSIFLYFNDPDGMTIEYTLGMEEFDASKPRAARQLEPSLDTVDMWGGAPKPEYAKTGLIESSTH